MKTQVTYLLQFHCYGHTAQRENDKEGERERGNLLMRQQWTLSLLTVHALVPQHYTLDLHPANCPAYNEGFQTPLSNNDIVLVKIHNSGV